MPELPQVLVLACGALAKEYLDLIDRNDWNNVTVECLPAKLHNTPEQIPGLVDQRLDRAKESYDHILVGYADCGTGGLLDKVINKHGVTRLPGDHCYEFYATTPVFSQVHEAELGTFFLTDYLAKHFDRLIWQTLGLDRFPQLRDTYFAHYKRLIYLSQVDDPELEAAAREAADRLGLEYGHLPTGYGDLESATVRFVTARAG